MIPKTREEFTEWCLRKLGKPVIKINVDSTQIDDRIDEALYMFFKYNYEATENVYVMFSPTEADADNGYVTLPDDIVGVVDAYQASSTGNIFSADFQLRMSELYSLSSTRLYAGVNYYYTIQMHMELLNDLFSPQRSYDFNGLSHKLSVAGLREMAQSGESMILKVVRKIDSGDEMDTDYTPIKDLWKTRWLQNYAVELIRLQWAQNLSKYQNVQLLGGVMMNGEEMRQFAASNIERLEEELRSEYELPPMGFIG